MKSSQISPIKRLIIGYTRATARIRIVTNLSSLPTRVIDVGSAGVASIRLYCTSTGETGRYAALSYCWGGDQLVKTTQKLMQVWSKDIPLSELAKTIQDAIYVTRKLGLQYLWVDAVCIIQVSVRPRCRVSTVNTSQDDSKYVAYQMSQMPAIYQGAYVTIIAGSAGEVAKGSSNGGNHLSWPVVTFAFPIDVKMVDLVPLYCHVLTSMKVSLYTSGPGRCKNRCSPLVL